MAQKREFTGVWIPKEIILDERLKPIDKILYAEIACFEECYKKQSELLKICGVGAKAFQASCRRLTKFGYMAQCRKFGRVYRKSTFSTPNGRDEQSQKGADEQSQKGAVHLENTSENNNIADVKSAEKTFNQNKSIQKMRGDKNAHIRLIGWYFEKRGAKFPSESNLKQEIKRWCKDATFICKYPQEQVAKTHTFVSRKFPEEWNLSTIRKYISEIK
jgi:hypothetical protein